MNTDRIDYDAWAENEQGHPAFKAWMKAVDNEVEAIIGLSIHDLEDHPFMDWFADEMTPQEAAHIAIVQAGGGDLL